MRIKKDRLFFTRGQGAVYCLAGAVLVMLLLATGCSRRADDNLSCAKVEFWNLPPDGKKIAAPRSLTIDADNNLLVLDDAGRVLRYSPDGKLLKMWRMPDSAIGRPEGVCVLADGRIAVSDTHYSRVVIFEHNGKVSLVFGKKGTAPGEFSNPVGICCDGQNNLLVCEYGEQSRVQRFTTTGKWLGGFGEIGEADGKFQRPSGVVWYKKRIYVADAVNNRVQVFADDGKFLRAFDGKDRNGICFYLPYDLFIVGDGSIYVIEYGNACVSKIAPDGRFIGRYYGKNSSGQPLFRTPWGIAVDKKNRVYVADTGNRRIVVLDSFDGKNLPEK